MFIWTIKKAERQRIDLWTVVLEKSLKSPLVRKKIKPVNPKGNKPWILTGRTDAKSEAPILGPPDVKNWLIGQNPDAGKDWRQEEKEATEDEMVGWHHWLNGREFEQAPGDSEGQGGLACFSPWGPKESYDLVTEQQQKGLLVTYLKNMAGYLKNDSLQGFFPVSSDF